MPRHPYLCAWMLCVLVPSVAYPTYGQYDWCSRNAAGMISGDGGINWQWKAGNPCGMHDLSVSEMRETLAGLTVMFVGDSHSRYMACALWGMLADGAKGCASQYKEDPTLRHGMFAMRTGTTTIIFKWFPYLEFMPRWKNLEWFLNNTDALILNAGIHLFAHGRRFQEDADVASARELAKGIKDASSRSWPPRREFPLVVWRETTHTDADAGTIRRMNSLFLPIFDSAGLLVAPAYNLTQSGCVQDAVGHCTPGACCVKLNQFLLNILKAALRRRAGRSVVGAASPPPEEEQPVPRRVPSAPPVAQAPEDLPSTSKTRPKANAGLAVDEAPPNGPVAPKPDAAVPEFIDRHFPFPADPNAGAGDSSHSAETWLKMAAALIVITLLMVGLWMARKLTAT